MLGREAPGLSASTIGRLKAVWQDEHARWSRRDLSNRRYVYLWVDGIHFGVRLEDAAQCILVVIGATAEGKKELVTLADGYRESEASWREVLLDLKARGLKLDPHLATGILEGITASLRHDPWSTLLGTQDCQRAQQATQEPAT